MYYKPYKQIVQHKQETGTQRSSNNNWLYSLFYLLNNYLTI